jgi:hypothetical protein
VRHGAGCDDTHAGWKFFRAHADSMLAPAQRSAKHEPGTIPTIHLRAGSACQLSTYTFMRVVRRLSERSISTVNQQCGIEGLTSDGCRFQPSDEGAEA